MSRGRRWPYAVAIPAALLCWGPLYFTAVVASRESDAAFDMPPALVPGGELIENVLRVFTATPLAGALVNSLIVCSVVAAGQALLCSLAAFAFAKLRFRGAAALFGMVLLALAVPTQLNVIPRYLLTGWLGWVETLTALIVPGLVSAFGIVWMRQSIAAALPDETIDAAALDGCGPWRTFAHVAFPVLRPGAAVLAGLIFVSTWGDYLWPSLVARGPRVQTVQVALGALQSDHWVDHSLVFTGALISTAPVIVVLLLSARLVWRPAR
jgi:cellobiose transport system permease protein